MYYFLKGAVWGCEALTLWGSQQHVIKKPFVEFPAIVWTHLTWKKKPLLSSIYYLTRIIYINLICTQFLVNSSHFLPPWLWTIKKLKLAFFWGGYTWIKEPGLTVVIFTEGQIHVGRKRQSRPAPFPSQRDELKIKILKAVFRKQDAMFL